jgi:hypothetical protein
MPPAQAAPLRFDGVGSLEDNMAYELSAVLGERELLETLAGDHGVPVVALGQGFGLIPLTSEVVDVLVGDSGLDAPVDHRTRQRRLDDLLKGWSARGPIVHATGETHGGGPGEQTARIWRNGVMVFAQKGNSYSGPISMALQRLGVAGGRIGWDEFDVVGLGRHRKTVQWFDAARGRTLG